MATEPAPEVSAAAAQPAPQGNKPVSPDKIEKHLQRARKGVLSLVADKGTCSLAEMHDYSERRYFIGHKKFSDMLEGLIDDELLLYSWEESSAAITDKGRSFIGG